MGKDALHTFSLGIKAHPNHRETLSSEQRRTRFRRKDNVGEFLIGTVLLIAVVGVLSGSLIQHIHSKARVAAGTKTASEIIALNDFVGDLRNRYRHDIVEAIVSNNTSLQHGTIDIALPDIAQSIVAKRIDEKSVDIHGEQLGRAMGWLHAQGLSAAPAHGGEYIVRFTINSTGDANASCTPSGSEHCSLDTLLYMSDAPYRGGTLDLIAIHAAIRALGPGGGYARPSDNKDATAPSLFFPGMLAGKRERENPAPGKPRGILALATNDSSGHGLFLSKRGGSMSGSIDMGRNDITNVGRLSVGSLSIDKYSIKSPSILLRSDEVHLTDGTAEDRAVRIRGGSMSVPSLNTASLQVDSLVLKTNIKRGSSCEERQIGYDDTGKFVSCQKRRWTPLPPGDKGINGNRGGAGQDGTQGRPGRDGRNGRPGATGDVGDAGK